MGWVTKCGLITDGRFSDNNGCFVGHTAGKPLMTALSHIWRTETKILVDVLQGTIEAPGVDFTERRWSKACVQKKITGCLYQYARNVSSASKGGIIPVREL